MTTKFFDSDLDRLSEDVIIDKKYKIISFISSGSYGKVYFGKYSLYFYFYLA